MYDQEKSIKFMSSIVPINGVINYALNLLNQASVINNLDLNKSTNLTNKDGKYDDATLRTNCYSDLQAFSRPNQPVSSGLPDVHSPDNDSLPNKTNPSSGKTTKSIDKSSRLSCSFCGKRFAHSGDHRKHRRSHTGERPYRCAVCPKAFGQPGNLRRHSRLHSGEKPYPCNGCGRAFARTDKLVEHRLRCSGCKVERGIP